MGIKLASLALKKQPVLTVEFRRDASGGLSHTGEGEVVWIAVMQHIDQERRSQIVQQTASRRMTDVKKFKKETLADMRAAQRMICAEAIQSWNLTVGACREMQIPLDYSKAKATDTIDFNAENLSFLAENGDFGSVVLRCLNDFDFWFPEEQEQLGNSESGPTGSM